MFVPLPVKSDYSLVYGTSSVDELVERGAALGYSSLALTHIENLYGLVREAHQCALHGLRPLTGIELRPGFDGRSAVGSRRGRLVLLHWTCPATAAFALPLPEVRPLPAGPL